MSIAIMTRLFKAKLGSTSRKMLAIRLGDFADDEGRGIWPSVARLATETELSERTVQRLLQDFVTEGLLIVVKEGGSGRGNSTRYDFDMAALERLAANNNSPIKGDTMSPLESDRVTSTTDKGDTDDSLGCHHVTQTVIEPLDKPSIEREARECEGKKSQSETLPPEDNRNSAAFEKRVMRLCTGKGFFSGEWQDWSVGASFSWICDRFAELSPQERLEAEKWRDAYLLSAASRKKAPQAIGNFFKGRVWTGLDPALFAELERARAAEATKIAPVRKLSAPYGKMWGAARMAELLAGAKPVTRPSRFIESMIRQGGEVGAKYHREWLMKAGYPVVVDMHEAAKARRGFIVDERFNSVIDRMEQVLVDSEYWHKWRELHEQKGWLWFDENDLPDWVWFPAGGADSLHEFEAALQGLDK